MLIQMEQILAHRLAISIMLVELKNIEVALVPVSLDSRRLLAFLLLVLFTILFFEFSFLEFLLFVLLTILFFDFGF